MMPFITVVIPARNEEGTVAGVVAAVRHHPVVARVIVVDNGSDDTTAIAAAEAGAHVFSEPTPGLGRAFKRGIAAADTEYILRTDADISNWNPAWVDHLCHPKRRCLTRAVFTSPYDEFPVTRLVVRPYLEMMIPALADLPTPISGTYCFRADEIEWRHLPDDWSCDIALVIHAYERGIAFDNIDIGILSDRPRDINHNERMAREIHRFFINHYYKAGSRSSV